MLTGLNSNEKAKPKLGGSTSACCFFYEKWQLNKPLIKATIKQAK